MLSWLLGQFRGSLLFYRGNKLYQAGSFADAVILYRETLQYQPDRAVVHFNLGLALYKGGERRAAREEWERVMELSSAKNKYLHEQAQIMLRQFS